MPGAAGETIEPQAVGVPPLVYSIAEAAEVLRTSRDSVERLILRGDLSYVRVNKRNKVIPRAALERFIAANEETAA